MRTQITAANAARRRRIRENINEVKGRQGCQVCGETEPVALDFHHPSGAKESSINDMFKRDLSWGRIKKEIDKCEVLCANCHRKHHAGILVRGGS